MANITHLQMWKDICADDRIVVSKSFFGLFTNAVYNPTGSPLAASKAEYTREDGERLRRLLSASHDNLAEEVGTFHPKKTANGNFMAEVCSSHDGSFLAVRIYQFISMNYEPVIGTCCFEGDEARLLRQLF